VPTPSPTVSPRLRALYLAVLAVGVFLLPDWRYCAAVTASQMLAWLVLDLGLGALARQVRKLSLLLSVILVAYALVGEDPTTDRWQSYAVFGWTIDINIVGFEQGLAMVLRILAVVLASHVARAGDPRALAAGLRGLGLPRSAALAIDAVLVLLGDSAGRGKGDGSGGGGGTGSGGHKQRGLKPFLAGLARLGRGDVGLLVDRLYKQVARAERHVADGQDRDGPRSAAMARDIGVVAGIALTMLGIKALKLLPGLPFAPGHKGVLLIPLYIVAGVMTRSRLGATLTGLTMGLAAFLLGDGRYGVFEIAKHVAPGLLVDLLLPIMRVGRGNRGRVAWSLFGLTVALGRFATVTVIALAVQPPAVVFALLIPGLAVHAVFGILSGVVTAPLVRAVLDRRAADDERDTPHEREGVS